MDRADERRILKKYLTQYFRARERQSILTARLNDASSADASALEARIRRQARAAERCAMDVMDIIELLPDDSTERAIMELRHIDCKPWKEIRSAVHLTRSPCYEYYKRGLDTLLAFDEVRCSIGLTDE